MTVNLPAEVFSRGHDRMGNITAQVQDRQVVQRSYNGLNQMLEQQGGGVAYVSGALDRPAEVEQSDGRRSESCDDAFSRRARIVETIDGTVVLARDLVWLGYRAGQMLLASQPEEALAQGAMEPGTIEVARHPAAGSLKSTMRDEMADGEGRGKKTVHQATAGKVDVTHLKQSDCGAVSDSLESLPRRLRSASVQALHHSMRRLHCSNWPQGAPM